eukprot:TRINITY_DN11540_c0_g1_i1.p2 TRINITY_DN11540_c0_g1~~TRINITY_DN11540_c0_g1_i1.p2  ORF type:complete len:113 (+),score=23.17 TRINITY_DN11540_c0_g1_i1:124-462(+)
MKTEVCVHWPLTLGGPKIDHYEIDAEPHEPVSGFKARIKEECKIEQDITICIQGQARQVDGPVWDGDFVVDEATGKIFIQVRVEDAELNKQVAELLAKGSRIIPLDQVTIKN